MDCASVARPVTPLAGVVARRSSCVGLKGYEQQFSGELSGGEQQRAVSRVQLLIRPRVLLFDEPLSNLDAKLRFEMRQEIRRPAAPARHYRNRMSHHDQEEAMAVSDRIAVMNQGTVVQEGSAADLYHRPASEFVARFVGRVNIVTGRVVQVAGDTLQIAALGSVLGVRWTVGGFVPGDSVRVVVDPKPSKSSAADSRPAGRRPSYRGSRRKSRVLATLRK